MAHISSGSIFRHIYASVGVTVVLGIVCCGIYPAVVWGIGHAAFPKQANGSLIKKDGTPTTDDTQAVGSMLIGQAFSAPGYFHPRPSAAGSGYDGSSSGGSNLGPLSAKLIHGTFKNNALTIFAFDKSHHVGPVANRAEGAIAAATGRTITITPTGTTGKATYMLDATVADPNTVVNSRGRTIHASTLGAATHAGASVELKLNGNPLIPLVLGINVIDQELDAVSNTIDTNAKTITLPGNLPTDSPTVVNVDPKNTVFVVNGNASAKFTDITPDMGVHVVVSVVMDYDGLADRVIHYCEDNSIPYQCSIPITDFKDADGIDDSKLNQEMNGASTPPTITPAKLIPGDAVTGSGSGLDPHISPANAVLQINRVATARGIKPEQVQPLVDQYTDQPQLGVLGDPGVNVLRLNVALDAKYPIPATPSH
jgi:K+-transporting ATPase KdpC subunit